jgi:hypothetical protein
MKILSDIPFSKDSLPSKAKSKKVKIVNLANIKLRTTLLMGENNDKIMDTLNEKTRCTLV